MLKRLILVALLASVATAHAGTLESVRQKGFVACGVNVGLVGFSMPDSKGVWRGACASAGGEGAGGVLAGRGCVPSGGGGGVWGCGKGKVCAAYGHQPVCRVAVGRDRYSVAQ